MHIPASAGKRGGAEAKGRGWGEPEGPGGDSGVFLGVRLGGLQ